MSLQEENFSEIADKIREKTGTVALIAPNKFAEKIDTVYHTAYNAGETHGFIQGLDDGKELSVLEFWNKITNSKHRTDYTKYFYGPMWNDVTFKPPYKLTGITVAEEMFYSSGVSDLSMLDLTTITNAIRLFIYSTASSLGVIDVRSFQRFDYAFCHMANLTSIEKIIIGNEFHWSCCLFARNPAVREVRIEGTIAEFYGTSSTAAAFANSTNLSKDSILSLVGALSDNVSGQSMLLNRTAINRNFTTAEFNALKATKPNWSISLIS